MVEDEKVSLGEMDTIGKPEDLPKFSPPTLICKLADLEGVRCTDGIFEAWIKGTLGENDPDLFLIGLYDSWVDAVVSRVSFIEDTLSSARPRVIISEDDLKLVSDS